jgi:hypothetical protein
MPAQSKLDPNCALFMATTGDRVDADADADAPGPRHPNPPRSPVSPVFGRSIRLCA